MVGVATLNTTATHSTNTSLSNTRSGGCPDDDWDCWPNCPPGCDDGCPDDDWDCWPNCPP